MIKYNKDMFITRLMGVASILSVLLISTTVFAAAQNPDESLNRLNAQTQIAPVVLDETAKNNVQNSCQRVQDNLRSIRQKEQRIFRERNETYLDVQNEIDALQQRVKRQGINVDVVRANLMNYRESTDQYERLSKSYQEALSDTTVIDCRANPAVFVTGVELIKQKRVQLEATTNTIKDYIDVTVPKSFDAVQVELKV